MAQCPAMAQQPWDYPIDESEAPTGLELQRKLYEGFFKSWYGNPAFGGFMAREWRSQRSSLYA
jgi:hypothetical protein